MSIGWTHPSLPPVKIPHKYHILPVLVCARMLRLCLQMQMVTLFTTVSFNCKVAIDVCHMLANTFLAFDPRDFDRFPFGFISIQASSFETSHVCAVDPNSNPSATGEGLWQAIITLTFMFSHWHSLGGEACLLWHYNETSLWVWPAASNSSAAINARQYAALWH